MEDTDSDVWFEEVVSDCETGSDSKLVMIDKDYEILDFIDDESCCPKPIRRLDSCFSSHKRWNGIYFWNITFIHSSLSSTLSTFVLALSEFKKESTSYLLPYLIKTVRDFIFFGFCTLCAYASGLLLRASITKRSEKVSKLGSTQIKKVVLPKKTQLNYYSLSA